MQIGRLETRLTLGLGEDYVILVILHFANLHKFDHEESCQEILSAQCNHHYVWALNLSYSEDEDFPTLVICNLDTSSSVFCDRICASSQKAVWRVWRHLHPSQEYYVTFTQACQFASHHKKVSQSFWTPLQRVLPFWSVWKPSQRVIVHVWYISRLLPLFLPVGSVVNAK